MLEAYERLIHDAMSGDHTLFTAADDIERLWELSAPLLETHRRSSSTPRGPGDPPASTIWWHPTPGGCPSNGDGASPTEHGSPPAPDGPFSHRPSDRRPPASSTRPPGSGRAGTGSPSASSCLRGRDSPRPQARAKPARTPVVTHRPHVEPAQGTDQEHLRRPRSDAPDLGEVVDHLLVGEPADPVEPDRAGDDLLGQVADGGGLGAAQPAPGQRLRRGGQHRLRGDGAPQRLDEPSVDGCRRLSGQLLVDDGPGQGRRSAGRGRGPAAAGAAARAGRRARRAPASRRPSDAAARPSRPRTRP